jgi:hypothetical protein
MPTKRQREIAELTRIHLREGEQILHYGEAKPSYWQAILFSLEQSTMKLGKRLSGFTYSIWAIVIFLLISIAIAEMLGLLALIITIAASIAIVLMNPALWSNWIGITIFMLMGLMFTIALLAFLIHHMLDTIPFRANSTKENETFQNIAYIITSQRILIFDKDGLGEYPFELLTDTVLSKAQNGLSSIFLYTSKSRKPKLPEPNYRLLDIPEEDAQTAYQILQEAREYEARVRDRSMWLESEQKQKRERRE